MNPEPHQWDVLCGRGMTIRTHEGNKHYIQLIHDFREAYENAPKGRKMDVVNQVVDAIQEKAGRFLQKKGADWAELEADKAIQKTAQAFRDLRAEDTTTTGSSSTVALKAKSPTIKKKPTIKKFDYSLLKKHAPAGRFAAFLAKSENKTSATPDATTEETSSSSGESSDSGSDNDDDDDDDKSGASATSSSEEESDHGGDVSETETEDSFPISRSTKSK